MSALSFPCTIFTTKKRMDDFGAKDMHCGDLSAEQLKKDFGLSIVSDRVDPWTLERKKHQQVSTYPASSSWKTESISKQECINILFDEFRACSKTFSFYGPYKDNIIEMITHMQHKNKIQDHFGLDNQDIQSWKFRQFNLFRIWFVLQRYSNFAFKPFMTNMEATIEITGERDVK